MLSITEAHLNFTDAYKKKTCTSVYFTWFHCNQDMAHREARVRKNRLMSRVEILDLRVLSRAEEIGQGGNFSKILEMADTWWPPLEKSENRTARVTVLKLSG